MCESNQFAELIRRELKYYQTPAVQKKNKQKNTSAHLLQNTLTCGFNSTPRRFLNGRFLTWTLVEKQSYQGAPQHRGRLHLVPRFSLASPGFPFPFSLVFSAQLNINGLLLQEDAPAFTLTSYHD